jgi:YD repeat-containing protein
MNPAELENSVAKGTMSAGDPFDLQTGIYYRDYKDLFIADSIPIDFVRTQRNMDPRSRSFGVGASTSYDMFIIGDTDKFSWVALVFASGLQERFVRVSPGTGYADGIFENSTSPGKYRGARISWNGHNAWTVLLTTGIEFTVQGCGGASRPGQCAVIGIRDVKGDRLQIQRDAAGNMLKIVSPRDRFIAFTYDSQGRITRAEDDSHRWINYEYDSNGCLLRARSWRGESQVFRYDDRLNMTYVRETAGPIGLIPAYDVTVENVFDEKDRLKSQRVSNGDFYTAKYITDAAGLIRETDVQSREGLTRNFFSAAHFPVREELLVDGHLQWTLVSTRDPESNVLRGMTLTCKTAKIHLPLSTEATLSDLGEAGREFLSDICVHAEEKQSPPPGPGLRNQR